MRNVKREYEPQSLRNNVEEWRAVVGEAKSKGESIPKGGLLENYHAEDVRAALRRMYSDERGCYCCYCEARLDEVSYDHIEHRKPKSVFPECALDWENLHVACQKCNMHKLDQWDDEYPILDAVLDPIDNNLGYRKGVKGVYRETLSLRGITTVKHADLDRPELLRGRRDVWDAIEETIREIRALGDDPRKYTRLKMLRDECSGKYGSLIRWLLQQDFSTDPVWRGLCSD
jgi:5-methylcytosine-specific restriction endonuclease McrA